MFIFKNLLDDFVISAVIKIAAKIDRKLLVKQQFIRKRKNTSQLRPKLIALRINTDDLAPSRTHVGQHVGYAGLILSAVM